MKDKKEKNNEVIDDITFIESTEDGEVLLVKDTSKKLRSDLKICRKEKEEYLTGWQRAKADYINLQKELDQVKSSNSALTKESMVFNLLPAIDSFNMAFNNKEAWEKVDKEWRIGIEYIYQQFMTGLSVSGIENIDTVDISFDPKIHDSVKIIETKEEEKDHTIIEVIQVGYKIGDRVIRPAKVTVYEYKK